MWKMKLLFWKKKPSSAKTASIIYTEDRVPVYTLYLEDVPQTTTTDELRKYFSTLGEVASVSIIAREFQRNLLYGYVEFTKPEFAAMALKQSIHRPIPFHRMKVEPADTWKQPAIEHIAESKTETDPPTEDSSSPAASILNLNDDCLINIFSFLNQIEKLKLSFICQRFCNIVKHAIKVTKWFDFEDMDENFTLMQIRQILMWFGSDIRRLRLCGLNVMYKRYVYLIVVSCRNLKEVEFQVLPNIQHETYKRFFNSSKQLQTLVLDACNINDELCRLISLLPALKSLNLSKNWDITGRFLRHLTSLTELNLSYCKSIEPVHFIDICKSLKLTSLNIVGCFKLTDEAFLILAETQTALEQLTISNSYGDPPCSLVHLVGRLNALKHIRICWESYPFARFNANILREIVNNRKEVLESLEIYELPVTVDERNCDRILELRNLRKFCLVRDSDLDDSYLEKISKNCKLLEQINIAESIRVSNNGVLSLVRNLKHLKFLNISFCERFEKSLIYQIYSALDEAGDTKREGPLTLYVAGTRIAESFLKKRKYQKYKTRLLLSFEFDLNGILDVV